MSALLVRTIGFSRLPAKVQAKIMSFALKWFRVSGKVDMVVFYPHRVDTHPEDDGRTVVTHVEGLTTKVFAIKEDLGDPEKWEELYHEEDVKVLRNSLPPGTRYVITFMLADEY